MEKDYFASLVETDLATHYAKQKSLKKTLTIPAWINDFATEKGFSCSAILQEGIMGIMNK